MSQTGYITVYSSVVPADTFVLLQELVQCLQPQSLVSASRMTDARWLSLTSGAIQPDDFEMRYGPVELSQLRSFMDPRKCTSVDFGVSDMLITAAEEVASIDQRIRGEFALTSVYVCIGPHDLFEAVDSPKFFGRAHASVKLVGYGSPNNWPEARKRIAALPSVKRLEELCRPIMGEVQTCVFWDG